MYVKDEAEIVAYTLRHAAAHVDQILVTDNLSEDGTAEIVASLLDDEGLPIELAFDDGFAFYQSEKTTALAMRALELGHEWVVPMDADEIWYPASGGLIKNWLPSVAPLMGFVEADVYNHVASSLDPEDEPNPLKRIAWRMREPIRLPKIASRLRPDLTIGVGNHVAHSGSNMRTIGLEVRHFPYRSPEQFVAKAIKCGESIIATTYDEGTGAHCRGYLQLVRDGGEDAAQQWYREYFYLEDPAAAEEFIHDPAPLLGQTERSTPCRT